MNAARCGGVELHSQGVEVNPQGVEPHADGVELRTQGVELNSDGVAPRTQGVELRSEGVERNAQGVELQSEGVELRTGARALLTPPPRFRPENRPSRPNPAFLRALRVLRVLRVEILSIARKSLQNRDDTYSGTSHAVCWVLLVESSAGTDPRPPESDHGCITHKDGGGDHVR